MKKLRYIYPLFLCACLSLSPFPGLPSACAEEPQKKFPIESSLKDPRHLKAKISPGVPIKAGEEIPDWVARWELAKVLSYVKRYDESLTEYQKLLKEKPDLLEARGEMANVLFWKGDGPKALAILEQIPPEKINGKTRVLMADLYVSQKEYNRAETIYRAHLKKEPQDHAVRLKLADMLGWSKQYDASLREYERILKAMPDDIQVRRRYAFVLVWAGRHSEAAAQLKKTLK